MAFDTDEEGSSAEKPLPAPPRTARKAFRPTLDVPEEGGNATEDC